MKKIVSIYQKYTNKKIVFLTILLILTYAILPFSGVMFLKGFLSYIETKSDTQLLAMSATIYLLSGFIGPLLSQIFETALSEFRLSQLVTGYFKEMLLLPLEKMVSEEDLTIISEGELFSAQSWKGYQRLMKLIPISMANVVSLLFIGLMNDASTKIFMIVMIALALIANRYNSQILNLNKEMDQLIQRQRSYTSFYSSMLTNNRMLREVKSSHYEDFIKQKNFSRLDTFFRLSQKKIRSYRMSLAVTSLLSSLPYFIGVVLILLGLSQNFLKVSDGILYLSIIKVIQDSIFKLLKNNEKIKTDIHLYEMQERFISMTLKVSETQQKNLIGEIKKIEFVNVSYKYPNSDRSVVKNITYCLTFPKRIAIVGESGAGKTTIVKLLCGFLRPTEGYILVNGIDLREIDLSSYHKQLATVFQKTDLLAFTFRENLLQTQGEYQLANVDAFIKNLGMEKLIKQLPNGLDNYYTKHLSEEGTELSGGQLQMFLLLRSMIKKSSLYILDEATSAMDINNEVEVVKEFLKVTTNKMSVIITHRLLISKFCDDIVVLDKGKIVETGTHPYLLEKKGHYADLYKLQNEGYEV